MSVGRISLTGTCLSLIHRWTLWKTYRENMACIRPPSAPDGCVCVCVGGVENGALIQTSQTQRSKERLTSCKRSGEGGDESPDRFCLLDCQILGSSDRWARTLKAGSDWLCPVGPSQTASHRKLVFARDPRAHQLCNWTQTREAHHCFYVTSARSLWDLNLQIDSNSTC